MILRILMISIFCFFFRGGFPKEYGKKVTESFHTEQKEGCKKNRKSNISSFQVGGIPLQNGKVSAASASMITV